ncbi:MAG: S41 family peptidase, partial [Blastocatellia bacterium]|nr:S41 family peptidase [Blastocatellia bacterium]
MSFRGKLSIISISLIVALYAIVGGFLSVQKDVFAKGDPYVQLRIFGEVLRHIVRDYVDEPDLEKVRVGALRGLTEGLDPYSSYLTPEQVKKFRQPTPEQMQTGLVLSKVAGYIYVVSVLKGSPAEKVGLRSGDFLEYVNGFASRDISLYDAEDLIGGQPGTEVEVKVFRRGRPYKVKLKRGEVVQPSVEASILEPGIGYVKLNTLAEGKATELKKSIQDLQKRGAQKLILDLRGVANGNIEAGIEATNIFVKSGTIAKTLGHNNAVTATYEADTSAVFTGQVVLIADRSTANAAEIIVAAFAANKRGEIVGERTFGSGSEQRLFELKNGAALLLTVTKYATPSGKAFMDTKETPGIVPTIEVKSAVATEEQVPEDDDQQSGQETEEADPVLPTTEPAPAEDLQLKKA